MTLTWRALPGVVLAAALLAPAVPAHAWSCTYYKWNAAAERWDRVALLQPEEEYEKYHTKPEHWQCKYCYVPFPVAAEDPDPTLPREMQEVVDDAKDVVYSTLAGNPFIGPACPPVPPAWDEPPAS